MNRVIHFEIPAANPEAVGAFYADLFGWKITKWDGPAPYWMVDTGKGDPGINGGIQLRQHPEQPVVNTVEVADLDASTAKVLAIGGQMALPKMAIPTIGWLCYCKDPDGNLLGMMQNNSSAK